MAALAETVKRTKTHLVASRDDGARDSHLFVVRRPLVAPPCPQPRRPPYPAQAGKFAIERGDGLVGAYSCARVCGGVACVHALRLRLTDRRRACAARGRRGGCGKFVP